MSTYYEDAPFDSAIITYVPCKDDPSDQTQAGIHQGMYHWPYHKHRIVHSSHM